MGRQIGLAGLGVQERHIVDADHEDALGFVAVDRMALPVDRHRIQQHLQRPVQLDVGLEDDFRAGILVSVVDRIAQRARPAGGIVRGARPRHVARAGVVLNIDDTDAVRTAADDALRESGPRGGRQDGGEARDADGAPRADDLPESGGLTGPANSRILLSELHIIPAQSEELSAPCRRSTGGSSPAFRVIGPANSRDSAHCLGDDLKLQLNRKSTGLPIEFQRTFNFPRGCCSPAIRNEFFDCTELLTLFYGRARRFVRIRCGATGDVLAKTSRLLDEASTSTGAGLSVTRLPMAGCPAAVCNATAQLFCQIAIADSLILTIETCQSIPFQWPVWRIARTIRMLSDCDDNAMFTVVSMTCGRSDGIISIQEIRLVLDICQRFLAPTHPSAAVLIEYAARELAGNEGAARRGWRKKGANSATQIRH